MNEQKEILTMAISDRELERRWQAVRRNMRDQKIDYLVMQNDNEWLGGYVKWFTDVPARNAQAHTVIFPLEEDMTTITHGGLPPGDMGPPAWTLRGVKTRLTAPFFQSVSYTGAYEAELAIKILKQKKSAKIGLLGKTTMSAAFYEHLLKNLPEATFTDASECVDLIKAIKSPEEIGLIRQTAQLQDRAMEYAKEAVRPGRRDFEIVADMTRYVMELGSEEQLILAGSGPAGQPVAIRKRHYQNRMLREGEQFTFMMEVNGSGGLYAEIGRIFFIGQPPHELSEAVEAAIEIQTATLKLLRPGADPADIWHAHNRLLAQRKFQPETRAYAHGQGYDLVERPLIRDDESMQLLAGMNIAVHPTIGTERVWAWVCDNYFITETGVSECLHQTPKGIIRV